MSTQPLFQLRKELSTSVSQDESDVTQSFVEELKSHSNVESSVGDKFTNEVIVTENEKYTVSKLPASLGFLPSTLDIEGLVDTYSGNASVNDRDNLYIWPYNSTQKQPSFIRVPLHEECTSLSCIPSVIFTWPAAIDDESTTKSAGVCIVNKKSGLVQFYEDIDTITNISSLLSKDKVYELDLRLKDKEVITNVLNCEPAGVVISTSNGRLLFITIRDFMGKPSVNLRSQLVKSQVGFFRSSNRFKEFVSLQTGAILGKGERIVSTVTRGGEFQVWNLSAVANSYKRIEVNLYDQILDSLQDLYPFANGSLQVLNSHPLPNDQAHLILSSIVDHDGTFYYILSTIKLDEKTNSFVIFSTYRLNTYTAPLTGSHYPKILVPSFLKTEVDGEIDQNITSVFVIFPDAVVLTQTSSQLDQSYPLRRKWEDIISFRGDVHLVGHGYDADSIFLINKEMGVLKITANAAMHDGELGDVRFIKSHIDQAIYFSNTSSNLIEFNLPENISLERNEIESDLLDSSREVLLSTSSYIPPKLSTLDNHVKMRVDLFKHLLAFTKANFLHRISPQVKLDLIESYEVLNCAQYFLSFIENNSEIAAKWNELVSASGLSNDSLFHHEVNRFPQMLSQLFEHLNDLLATTSDLSIRISYIDLIISCIYKATLEDGEQTFRFEQFQMATSELNDNLPWFAQHNFPKIINEAFFILKESAEGANNLAHYADKLLILVRVLYYVFKQLFLWYSDKSSRQASAEYQQLHHLFESSSLQWNRTLCEVNYPDESLRITEFYEDLASLVETLDAVNEDLSAEVYEQYFKKFGYSFAEKLFAFYISTDKLQNLYFKFPDQHEYLNKFFEENPQYGNVEWIGDIFEEKYGKALRVLTRISCTKDATTEVPLVTRQFRLSVAKLCGLADGGNTHIDEIYLIQASLDAIDGQKDIVSRLNRGTNLHKRFETSVVIKDFFHILCQSAKSQNGLSLSNTIDFYTILDSKHSFFCALKLLSLNMNYLSFEVTNFLNVIIWRRCILFDNWQTVGDAAQTALSDTLEGYFSEELYNSGCSLPRWSQLIDSSLVTAEYFQGEYGDFVTDASGLFDFSLKEIECIRALGDDFSVKIKAMIGAANEKTGKKCTVNYETNTIEKLST
ncbi:LAFE_0F01464g1_1 [Lachancea fermentati]|uniref:LAFE_0F01464g1_1 n=1 Tax=Lachancea fermentati TaxID=4955 RepID=A0A1G4ME54_LACFM|nr:LAFE_0F01464g1_1 [Lachancea fermentati]